MREVIIDEKFVHTTAAFTKRMAEKLGLSGESADSLSVLEATLEGISEPTRIVVRRLEEEGPEDRALFDRIVKELLKAANENPLLDVIAYEDDIDEPEHGRPEGERLTADEALARLKRGNAQYLSAHTNTGNVSASLVHDLFVGGQRPFATIITCADSRVVPEHIFMAGLGELFVIRVAGNVIGEIERASAVYAASHLHTNLVLVLGHTHCGAIEAAMEGGDHGSVNPLIEKIEGVIEDERDPYAACVLNVRAGINALMKAPEIVEHHGTEEARVVGAVYHTHSGVVDFLE